MHQWIAHEWQIVSDLTRNNWEQFHKFEKLNDICHEQYMLLLVETIYQIINGIKILIV